MKTIETAYKFFFRHAGFSYGPNETPLAGHRRCAKALADDEAEASKRGFYCRWELDGSTNREWTDEGEETPTWSCIMFDAEGVSLASLFGIDFGDGEPWGNPYRRVAEAELAGEALANS